MTTAIETQWPSLSHPLNSSHIVRISTLLDYSPNVVYATRGGVRFVYLIEDITDPTVFEAHYQSLLEKLAEPLTNHAGPYQIDRAVRDWTRLFRAPAVVRDDVEEFDYPVAVLHLDRLNLTTLRMKPRKALPTYTGNETYRGTDRKFISKLVNIRDGNRNNAAFRAAAYVLSRYDSASAELLLPQVEKQALDAGLEQGEIDQIIKSTRAFVARQQKEGVK